MPNLTQPYWLEMEKKKKIELSICHTTLNTSLLNQRHHFGLTDNHTRAEKSWRKEERYEDGEGEVQNEWMSDISLQERRPQSEVWRKIINDSLQTKNSFLNPEHRAG